MSLGGLTEEGIRDKEQQLLESLNHNGGQAGNVTLLRELRWPDELYWSIRDRLVDSGQLILGRGRGGSVRLAPIEEPIHAPSSAVLTAKNAISEDDLYVPMSKVLGNDWVKDQRFGKLSIVEITAKQGRRSTGGVWTRPDIVVISYTALHYVPGKHFDVTTFEVKSVNGLEVTAVYEALAHRRAATRAYVLAHIRDEDLSDASVSDKIRRTTDEAQAHGVGLIIAGDPSDYDTWTEHVTATYGEPSPHALNDFLGLQLSDGGKQEILTWFR